MAQPPIKPPPDLGLLTSADRVPARRRQGAEVTMFEARQRLNRFIGARSSTRRKPVVTPVIIAADSKEPDRLFASTVHALRRSLDVTQAQLARASAVSRAAIEAIEAGGPTTGAERHNIMAAMARFSNSRIGQLRAARNRLNPSPVSE